jgi:hypothetical protein
MDVELKVYLEGMESRIVDGVLDRVGGLVGASETKIMDHVGGLIEASETKIMDRVGGRIDASEERMKDFTRTTCLDLETKLISEFWKWSRTSDLRTKQAITDIGSLNERVLAVEERILALERRKPN